MFLSIAEMVGVILVIWFIVSQIIIPLMTGTKMFPALRRSKKTAIEDLILDEKDKIEEEELLGKLKELRKRGKKQAGFTVVELLIVIAGLVVVGFIIAIIVVAVHFLAKVW